MRFIELFKWQSLPLHSNECCISILIVEHDNGPMCHHKLSHTLLSHSKKGDWKIFKTWCVTFTKFYGKKCTELETFPKLPNVWYLLLVGHPIPCQMMKITIWTITSCPNAMDIPWQNSYLKLFSTTKWMRLMLTTFPLKSINIDLYT